MPPKNKMPGGNPVHLESEILSDEQRRKNAEKYFEETGKPIPDWLREES